MNMLASGFENFINGIFANWQMLLFCVAAVLLLLTIAFRKFKTTAVILVVVAAGIGVALLIDLILKAIYWDLPDLVAFLVKWVPTVLFTAIVLVSTLIGLKRGLRKSLILLAHEVCIAAVCIIAYFVLIKQPAVNRITLNIVDFFMGGKGALARTLGVSTKCSGIKEVFVEWLPTVIKGDFSIMLGESKAYIYTLADLIYRVAFALLLYIVFLILDFIMYVVYLCCYSERKYRAKIKAQYVENKVDRRYSKHHTGGGVVGLVRGLAIGLISLSFLGTALYIVAGRGDGKMKDYDFGDKNVNEYYSVYRSIESYGTYGIFKVLNSISSTEDVPYYLFAADLVFSGELDDKEFGVSGNIVFREELSAYTEFARETMDLLLKYGGEELTPLIKGQATNGAFDTVLKVISKEGFRAEFDDLISEFDEKTYVINFALSFVNSAIANIDNMSFASAVSQENRELLKLLFTKGYLSDTIPDEYLLKQMVQGTNIQIVQPYINVAKLADKEDIRIIFNLVLDVLGKKVTTTDEVLKLVADVLPEVKKLSLLDESRAEELDPVLGRLYCYAANRYLSEEGTAGVYYADVYSDNIEWIGEINALIDVAASSVNLYSNISSKAKPLDGLIAVFDKDDPDYAENIEYFDAITNGVCTSRIIGKTLSTSKIYSLIERALSNLFNGIYIPDDIVYENTYDADGKLVAGEMYNLFNGLGALGKNSDILPMLKSFDKDRDMETFLKALAEALNGKEEKSGGGAKLADYVVQSKLLRSVMSAAVINYGEKYAYVPTAARETDGEGTVVKLIKREELTALFESLSELVDFILPVLQDGNADMKGAIADFVKKDVFNKLLDKSKIFEGTVALHLVNALKDDETVVISQSLKDDLDGWVTAGGRKGELKNLLGALDAAGIEVADIVSGTFDSDGILEKFTSDEFTAQDLQTCLKSGVLHYTVSKFLTGDGKDFGSFKLIVPAAAQQQLENDSIPALVKKGEIENILQVVKEFGLSSETDVSAVLTKLVENSGMLTESYIIAASVVYSLVENADVGSMFSLPEKYKNAATVEKLKKFNSSNPWKEEIKRLVDALDEIMGISSSEEFTFDDDTLKNSLSAFLKNMNGASSVNGNVSRLTVSYASEIVRNGITSKLNELLDGKIDEGILFGAKSGDGYYTEKELQSLANVLNIFDIDVLNIDADALTDKIKSGIFSLNDPAEGYSGSKLSVVYPSVIFSGILSKELNNVLLDSASENPAPMIDEVVLYKIRSGSLRYRQEHIRDLINSVNGFGIDSFDDLNSLDIDSLTDKMENMDEICKSVIMRGVFTKQLRENNTLGVYHPLAYEQDIEIIKTEEIKSIVTLVGKIDDVEDTYFDSVSLAKIRSSLFYDDGTVKSYLLLNALSDSIRENEAMIVNRSLIDEYDCIKSGEVLALCDAFIKMFGAEAKVSSLGENGFGYPDADKRAAAVNSEIVRAKLTDQFIEQNGGIFVSGKNLTLFTDLNGTRRALIGKYEINALFTAIDRCTGGEDFVIPQINAQSLKKYNDEDLIDIMFTSDIIRYKVCDYIVSRVGAETAQAKEEEAYALSDLQPATKYSIDSEKTKQIISGLK